MATTEEKTPKTGGGWKETLKTFFWVVWLFVLVGALNVVNTFYFSFSELAENIGGLVVVLLIGGFLVYVFWVGLMTVLTGKDKE